MKKRRVKVSGYSRITRVSPKTVQVTRVKGYRRQRPAKPLLAPVAQEAEQEQKGVRDEADVEVVKDCLG